MDRRPQDVLRAPLLHDLARVHDQDAAADHIDDAQVMGDQQDGRPRLFVDPLEDIEDMGLGRDIQGCRGLIRDEELGPGDDAHGDHGALAHAAGELMGVHPHGPLRIRQARHFQGLQGPGLDLLAAVLPVQEEHFTDLGPDPLQGIEAGHGLLEDHGHVAAVDLAALRGRDGPEVLAVEHHTALGHLDVVFEQVLQSQGRHALAAAGLSHDPDDLSLSHVEADAVDDLVLAAVLIQRHRHMLDFQNVLAHQLSFQSSCFRRSSVRAPSIAARPLQMQARYMQTPYASQILTGRHLRRQFRYFLRIPSPIQLRPTIVTTIMRPGARAAQGVEKMMSCASLSMRPQLGMGG